MKTGTDELRNLFKISFGHEISYELWDWKYFQNPLASNDPEMVVAVDNEKIIGARPLLLAEMWVGDMMRKVAQPCDTMVHPEYRREKLFSRMNQFAIDYFKKNDFAFFYNFPNEMSCPGYLKQGWQAISISEVLFIINNPHKLIMNKLKSRPLTAIGDFVYNSFFKPRLKIPKSLDAYRIIRSNHFTEEMKEIDSLRDKTAMDLVRSENYLRWRFDSHPEHQYKYILARDNNGTLCGYAVVSVQEETNGLMNGKIVDYLVKKDDISCFRVLIYECIKELRKEESDLISVYAFTQHQLRHELIKHNKFSSSTVFPFSRILNKYYFVSRLLDEQLSEKIDIYRIDNWRVTHAYHDIT